MSPERVGRHLSGGREPDDERDERVRKEVLQEALSFWATGVTMLAIRDVDDGAVHALTVSGFVPVSVDPGLVLASLGPNAAALPYLEEGTVFAISILGKDQKGIAARYADTFPVGPSPFTESGAPVVRGCVAWLTCEVEELIARGDHTLVLGRVTDADSSGDSPALAYYRRRYHTIGAE